MYAKNQKLIEIAKEIEVANSDVANKILEIVGR